MILMILIKQLMDDFSLLVTTRFLDFGRIHQLLVT